MYTHTCIDLFAFVFFIEDLHEISTKWSQNFDYRPL